MGIDFKMIKIHQIVTDSGPICKKNSGEFMLQKFNIKNSSNGQGLQWWHICSVHLTAATFLRKMSIPNIFVPVG